MPKSSKSFGELLVLGAAAVLIAGCGIAQATQGNSSSDNRTVGQPAAAHTQTITITPTLNPPSPTATVVNPPTATVTVPPDAMLQTVEQAIDWGLKYAHRSGANHPRLVKAELMPLGEAMTSTASDPKEVSDVDALGWDLSSAGWRVQFDSDEFFPDSCEPPVDDITDATPTPGPYMCGPPFSTAVYVFRASDGLAITIALSDALPQ